MNLGTKIYNYLAAAPEITAASSGRLFRVSAPENTQAPYLTVTVSSQTPEYTLEGPTGCSEITVEIEAAGQDYFSAYALYEPVLSLMELWPSLESEVESFGKVKESEYANEKTGFVHLLLSYKIYTK